MTQHNPSAHTTPTRIIASDFDGTLCDTYSYDALTNNHLPIIRDDIIEAASGSRLIIATARRATHPAIRYLWECGLVHPSMPVISENGGVIHILDRGVERRVVLAPDHSRDRIIKWLDGVKDQLNHSHKGRHLSLKHGETIVIARYQTSNGKVTRADQLLLLKRLRQLNPPSWLSIVQSGESVCIQHASVNKGLALREALKLLGIERSDAYVISLGDAQNDRSLLEEADLSIGVHQSMRPHATHTYTNGVDSALRVLKDHHTNTSTAARKQRMAHLGAA